MYQIYKNMLLLIKFIIILYGMYVCMLECGVHVKILDTTFHIV